MENPVKRKIGGVALRPQGTVYLNNGYWYWRGVLPGSADRVAMPLKMPGSRSTMRASKPREVAEAAAWRIIEEHARKREFERTRPRDALTVNSLCDRYIEFSKRYYRNALGEQTSTVASNAIDLRLFREFYGERYVADLEHHDMLVWRDALCKSGISRRSVNGRIATVKRMISWALDEDMIYAQSKAELTQMSPVRKYRTEARETEPVTSVPADCVEAVAASVAPSLGDMIRVGVLTGMRPEELCTMKWREIERRDEVWVYRPTKWKTMHKDRPRAIVIGPRAIGIILAREGKGEYVFSPAVAQAERLEEMRRRRKTKVQPSQECRTKESPLRHPGDHWTPDSYRRAIARKCAELGIPRWHPNQLRHNCATNVRRVFGMDAASAVLGHSTGMRITNRYSFEAAEDEMIARAVPAMMSLG
ncbi:MAG: tyrosine-type recombinase/integrase [Kiritimatiellae bacterium]|nr:tyrosine-type recombinase/integrase [Kiritimatiellia bacterium]